MIWRRYVSRAPDGSYLAWGREATRRDPDRVPLRSRLPGKLSRDIRQGRAEVPQSERTHYYPRSPCGVSQDLWTLGDGQLSEKPRHLCLLRDSLVERMPDLGETRQI